MKIIFLNPQIDAGHKISKDLQARGLGLLFAGDVDELWQMLELHGSSVDLVILHLENAAGKIEPQLQLIDKVKSHPVHGDLPMLLTTSSWNDAQCATHQQSAQGVNAYLHFPFSQPQLLEVIQNIFGVTLEGGTKQQPPPPQLPQSNISSQQVAPEVVPVLQPPSDQTDGSSSVVLEDLSQVFLKPEASESGENSIVLEAPDSGGLASTDSLSPSETEIPLAGLGAENPPMALPPATQEVVDTLAALEAPAAVELAPAEGISVEGVPVSEGISVSPEPALEAQSGAPPSLEVRLDLQLPANSPEDSGQLPPNLVPDELLEPAIDPSSSLQPPPLPEDTSEDTIDAEAAQAMPYVLPRSKEKAAPPVDPAFLFAEPVGDAVVPGGAAHAPDLETFKKYLLLREQDVAILSNQLKAAKEQMALVEQLLRDEKAKNVELTHITHEQKTKIENFGAEKEASLETLQNEITELRFQIKAKADRARVLEKQVLEVSEEMEHLKERVRTDIRKIRVREKELENRLEIMKKDSEALMSARETKITELKRKLDIMEFNMDLLQDQYNREKEVSAQLRERLAKAAQIIRMAGGLLDTPKGMGTQELLSEVLGAHVGNKEKAS